VDPRAGGAEFLQVPDGQVEDFQGGLLGGNWPRLRVTLRSRAFIDSMRLVVQITRLISGENARNG
jgi:hypothetical protein